MSLDHLDYTTQSELNYLIAKANNAYQVEKFIDFLTNSKIDRCDMPFDRICRKLLKIIDETQREITLKELLEDDEKSSKSKISKQKNSKAGKSGKKEHRRCKSYLISPEESKELTESEIKINCSDDQNMSHFIEKKDENGYFGKDTKVKSQFLTEANNKKKSKNKRRKNKNKNKNNLKSEVEQEEAKVEPEIESEHDRVPLKSEVEEAVLIPPKVISKPEVSKSQPSKLKQETGGIWTVIPVALKKKKQKNKKNKGGKKPAHNSHQQVDIPKPLKRAEVTLEEKN